MVGLIYISKCWNVALFLTMFFYLAPKVALFGSNMGFFESQYVGNTVQRFVWATFQLVYPTRNCHSRLKSEKKCNLGKSHCLPLRLKSTFFEIFFKWIDWKLLGDFWLEEEKTSSKNNDFSGGTHYFFFHFFVHYVLNLKRKKYITGTWTIWWGYCLKNRV